MPPVSGWGGVQNPVETFAGHLLTLILFLRGSSKRHILQARYKTQHTILRQAEPHQSLERPALAQGSDKDESVR